MLGTQNNSFHRLLDQIEQLIEKEVIQEEVIVQAGYTKYKSKNMEIFDLIPKDEFFNATDLIERLIGNNHRVIRYPLNGTWIDIGQQADLAKARELVKHLNNK